MADSWEDIVDSTSNIEIKEEPTADPPEEEAAVEEAAAEEAAAPEPAPEPEAVPEESPKEPEAKPEKVEKPVVPEPEEEEGDPREHLNIILIGHVDAGKSTISGNILYRTGMVDERTIQKYEREAKDKNRGTWFLAFIMDTNEEERAKGKTVEVGRAYFETKKKRYTILDAPGHRNYVPNMIMGVAQADIGVLVISARKGEFETGFEKGGQTREHATLAKTLGVPKLIVVVNKMDDHTVSWSQERFDIIQKKLTPFLRSIGYNPKTDLTWLPMSGYAGVNISDKPEAGVCDWFKGPTLLGALDDLDSLDRKPNASLRIPVLDKFKDSGKVIVLGKVEAGTVNTNTTCIIMPSKTPCRVESVALDSGVVKKGRPGENVMVGVKDIDESDVKSGYVLCDPDNLPPVTQLFRAQLVILELLKEKPLLTAGYEAVIHIHTAVEDCTIAKLVSVINKKTKKPSTRPPTFVRKGDIVTCDIELSVPTPIELYSDLAQLGRFTLRDKGTTIAIGKVISIPE